MVDLPPASPGWFIKPMAVTYSGTASAQIPTAAGLAANMDVTANTVVIGGGHTFQQNVLGGAHYSVATFLPYTSLDISANLQTPMGAVTRHSKVSGLGDLTVVPLMLAWKTGDWQIDTMVPVYAPTGSYEPGRLGNTGLNYWTIDPNVGVAYSSKTSGFNAMLRVGYAINSENPDTNYQSGTLLHLEAAIEQILPIGPGLIAIGAEGFDFEQITGDKGSGATLGDFKGKTAGMGPVLGYIQPLGTEALIFELKWLKELETRNRIEGDYLWLKVVYKF